MTTRPKQGLIGAVVLVGGLAWSYNYLKRVGAICFCHLKESYYRRGEIPPPSTGMLVQTMKTFLFAATLPITFPFILYRLFRGDWRGYQNFDPFGSFGGYQQDPRYQQYSTTRQNSGYGRRMEWQYVPGFGWRYVETQYGPEQQGQDNQSYYEDFEDFFENARREYTKQQQQQQQQRSYEDIFSNRSGMSRQEAYRVLGLQLELGAGIED